MSKEINSALDPLEEAQLVSKIKRINERLAEMERQFGKNSGIVEDYKNAIELSIPDPALNPNGRISRGKHTLKLIDPEALDELLKKQTAGQIKKAAKEEAKRESKATGDLVTIDDVLAAMDYVYDVMNDDPDEFYEAITEYWQHMGRGSERPSYTTLQTIIEANRREYDTKNSAAVAEAQNVKDKLFKRLQSESNIMQRLF